MEDDLDFIPLSKRQRLLVPTSSCDISRRRGCPPSPSECYADIPVKTVSHEVFQEWPGLPRGVKFDPTDEDLLWHLLAKIRKGKATPHPFINKFITSLDENDLIGYTHPERLPGINQDGSPSYFFHRACKHDNSGSQKHQKINCDPHLDIWWSKVGKVKSVLVDGIHPGYKSIMALYVSTKAGEKPLKTDWVMHQYHLGAGELKEEDFVVSKIFYQHRYKPREKNDQDMINGILTEVKPLVAAEQVSAYCDNEGQSAHFEKLKLDFCGNHLAAMSPRPSSQLMHNANECSAVNVEGQCHFVGEEESMDEFTVGCAEKQTVRSIGSSPDSSESVFPWSALAVDQIASSTKTSQVNFSVEQQHFKPEPEFSQRFSNKTYVSGAKWQAEEENAKVNDNFQCQNSASANYLVQLKVQSLIESSRKVISEKTGSVQLRTEKGPLDKGISGCSCRNPLSEAGGDSDNLSSTSSVSGESLDIKRRQLYEAFLSDANLVSQERARKNLDDCDHMLDQWSVTFPIEVKQELSEVGSTNSFHAIHNKIRNFASDENHIHNRFSSSTNNLENGLPCTFLHPNQMPHGNLYKSLGTPDSTLLSSDMNHFPLESTLETQCAEKAAKNQENIMSGSRNHVESSNIIPEEQNHTTEDGRQMSALSNLLVKVKCEPHESNLCVPCDGAFPSFLDSNILGVKIECTDDPSLDVIDSMPLKERMKVLASFCVPYIDGFNNQRCLQSPALIEGFDSTNFVNAKKACFAVRKKRKKTATDSVETALEEDAPGLLQVLLERGITVEEIKLYGDVEDGDAMDISSDEDSFEALETVINKLFMKRQSLLKASSVQQIRGSKADYCLACLISLIEQIRYLHMRNSPVEWGWCRDLQSFIFVFKRHNRIVLERPEYGYATYFFELVDALAIQWQVRRLVTAMKLASCSRTAIIENKSLLVGEDLSEGEACILEEYGWKRNTGLGSMLNYCDRVFHDKRSEQLNSEWRTKIVKMLMQGYDGGRTVLTNLPKKVAEYIGDQGPKIKLELESIEELASQRCYPDIKLEVDS